jgi:hypothetical protein
MYPTMPRVSRDMRDMCRHERRDIRDVCKDLRGLFRRHRDTERCLVRRTTGYFLPNVCDIGIRRSDTETLISGTLSNSR